MPEGDTVWLVARRLDEALASRVVVASDFRVPALATCDLTGAQVIEVRARGKHLLARFSDGRTLHTHLRMEGAWHLYRDGERWRGGPDHQVRVVLRTADRVAVGYRLGVVEVLATADEPSVVGHLGPDLLGPDWSEADALANLRSRPEREIGDALLDQRNLAGIGNLYRCESLFLSGVNPYRRVDEVEDLPDVVRRARQLLRRSIQAALARGVLDQVTTGDPRRPHYVFESTGRPCRRCGTPIISGEQGEPNRSRITYWCPRCQD